MRPSALLLALALGAVPAAGAAAQQPPVPALDRADLDTTCAPCDDFYRYATGGWEKRTPIPPAYASWSSFSELTQRNAEVVRGILETAAREAEGTADADRQRLGRFYGSCTDSAAVERRGMTPIADDLARIARIATRDELRAEIARLHLAGRPILFGLGSQGDAADSRRQILALQQDGLGLPDRDYYFADDSASRAIRAAYERHVAAMLRLVGTPAAQVEAQAAQVIALERALADSSLNRLQMRDPRARYHFLSVADAERRAPGMRWRAYLDALGLPRVDSVNLAQPTFFAALGRELETRPLEAWKAYLRFHVADEAAPRLSAAFVNQRFAYDAVVSGARELQPRWRRCMMHADRSLSDALGREYVQVAYTPAARAAMDSMIDGLLAVYRRRLSLLPWMGESTRQEALRKLGTFQRKVGYPDTWRRYDGMAVARDGWFENAQAAAAFDIRRELAKVGRATDRGEWLMTPPTVNAYYNAQSNEIGFPAGRLQPPFFHPSYDLAANYGGIGATIGHELSHGFDDQGRKYDAAGNLRDWWSSEDAARFGELAGRMERQYSAYTVLDGLHLNGRQTLGENIADNAGVSIAYEALQRALEGKPRELVDGFTPEQRFFLAWAQARRQSWRDASLRLAVQTGVHSPGEFRVNGPLSNMPEFAAAWGCKAGDRMVRGAGERVVIW